MALRRIVPLLATMLGFGCASPHPSTQKKDLEAIQGLFDEDIAAHLAADADRAAAVYTEDVVWLPPRGPVIRGRAAIRERYRDTFKRHAVQFSIQPEETQVFGNWAFSRGTTVGTIQPRDSGPPRALHDKYIAVFQRTQGGGWKIARLMWNPVADPADQ